MNQYKLSKDEIKQLDLMFGELKKDSMSETSLKVRRDFFIKSAGKPRTSGRG